MTRSPHAQSTAFDLFHRSVRKWVWDHGWTELHEIQERAARPILEGDTDLVIGAATAGGKTEAAFLPIASVLASRDEDERRVGLDVLYVSPLKALINDQYDRLRDLFEPLRVPVHRWHGDVPSSRKRKVMEDPDGVLLITPESLEAQFIVRGSRMPYLLKSLRYVIVDELHAFMGTERGRQLQSLLHRVELVARRRVPRIALSATLGDMDLACEFLRPGAGESVERVISDVRGSEVRLQIRGYEERPPRVPPKEAQQADQEGRAISLSDTVTGDAVDVARDLFEKLRGGRHIIFINRRADVELFTDLLRELCKRRRVPDEFWPHHGSLDRTLREDAEEALKEGSRPATVLATTTLELGIDVGQVETIAQLGPPPSVASMRQRLGRSGRRADPSVLRIYVRESEVGPKTAPQDRIRSSLVQAVAMVRLLIERWFEPPPPGALHLSTLVQQVLSLLAQHGGVDANQAYQALCSSGPFRSVSSQQFARLLRDLAEHELIKQLHTGELVLDLGGERLVNHYEFYAAFHTPDEYRIVFDSRALGSLPILCSLYPGAMIIFAGRRWQVVSVDEDKKIVDVKPAAGGRPPSFVSGSGALVHRRVRDEMRRTYLDDGAPPYLNGTGQNLLKQGREEFHRLDLANRSLVRWGDDTLLFPWTGDREMITLLLQLQSMGLSAALEPPALLLLGVRADTVTTLLERLVDAGPGDPLALATIAQNKQTEKHHPLLSDTLRTADYAAGRLDAEGAWKALQTLPEVEGKGELD